MTAKTELYEWPPLRSQRVKWALEELAIPYESRLVNMMEREQDGDAYRAIHPLGVVPALKTDRYTMLESVAIVLQLIDEQTERAKSGKSARIFAKLNSLVDPRTIEALYRASQAGVTVDLVIRGICCLRPGVEGISESIRVRSIVDRFLEHSRIFAFGPDSSAKLFLSSADWMPRNFYRRVEVMFPVESSPLRNRILNEIIPAYAADNVKARELSSDGTYHKVIPGKNQPLVRSQQLLLELEDEPLLPSPKRSSNKPKKSERRKK